MRSHEEGFEDVEARGPGAKFRDARGTKCAHKLRDDAGDKDHRFHGNGKGWRIVAAAGQHGHLGFSSYYVDSLGLNGIDAFHDIGEGSPIGVELAPTGEQAFALRMADMTGYLFVCSNPVVLTAEVAVASVRLSVGPAGWHEASDELRAWVEISETSVGLVPQILFCMAFGVVGAFVGRHTTLWLHARGGWGAAFMLASGALFGGIGVAIARAAPNTAAFEDVAQMSLLPNCSALATRENLDTLGLRPPSTTGISLGDGSLSAPFSDPGNASRPLNDTWQWTNLSTSLGSVREAKVSVCVGLQSAAGAATVFVDELRVTWVGRAESPSEGEGGDVRAWSQAQAWAQACPHSEHLVGSSSLADLAAPGSCGGVQVAPAIAAAVVMVLLVTALSCRQPLWHACRWLETNLLTTQSVNQAHIRRSAAARQPGIRRSSAAAHAIQPLREGQELGPEKVGGDMSHAA